MLVSFSTHAPDGADGASPMNKPGKAALARARALYDANDMSLAAIAKGLKLSPAAFRALRSDYRKNGRFLVNRKIQWQIRKFKASTVEYLWQPPAQLGATATLMNFAIIEAEDMLEIGAGSFSLAFADFNRCYLIFDRVGIRILRDPYST